MTGVFFIFLSFEFTMVTSFSLSTEIMPERRATMMAGFYATAGIGRMIGVLTGGFFWEVGGIIAVSWLSAAATLLALLALIWRAQHLEIGPLTLRCIAAFPRLFQLFFSSRTRKRSPRPCSLTRPLPRSLNFWPARLPAGIMTLSSS